MDTRYLSSNPEISPSPFYGELSENKLWNRYACTGMRQEGPATILCKQGFLYTSCDESIGLSELPTRCCRCILHKEYTLRALIHRISMACTLVSRIYDLIVPGEIFIFVQLAITIHGLGSA